MIAFEINIFLLVKFIIIPISMSFYLNIVLANEETKENSEAFQENVLRYRDYFICCMAPC